MLKDIITTYSDSTRRGALLDIGNSFSNVNTLRDIAGKNALVDCALVMYAGDDPELQSKLSEVLDSRELCSDIEHVRKSILLREKRKSITR